MSDSISPGEYIEIPWPQRKASNLSIFPLFLPFAGCRGRCIFCSQEAQTGKNFITDPKTLVSELENCERALTLRAAGGHPAPQLAFYGGTFTALDQREWDLCLDFACKCIRRGLIANFRCSTRPDKISQTRLEELSLAGCALMELGVQTFSEHLLEIARRGHTGRQCVRACAQVQQAGIEVCTHLMPGLPFGSKDDFLSDVEMALALGVKYMRFSPCLALKDTELAKMWVNGDFQPWNMETTLETLAKGYIKALAAGATVIRMGLAPEERLNSAILAGPAHPCLGARVISRATLITVLNMRIELEKSARTSRYNLYLPAWRKGDFRGWKGELTGALEAAGISCKDVNFWDRPVIRLERAGK